jgi:hypothetical protein
MISKSAFIAGTHNRFCPSPGRVTLKANRVWYCWFRGPGLKLGLGILRWGGGWGLKPSAKSKASPCLKGISGLSFSILTRICAGTSPNSKDLASVDGPVSFVNIITGGPGARKVPGTALGKLLGALRASGRSATRDFSAVKVQNDRNLRGLTDHIHTTRSLCSVFQPFSFDSISTFFPGLLQTRSTSVAPGKLSLAESLARDIEQLPTGIAQHPIFSAYDSPQMVALLVRSLEHSTCCFPSYLAFAAGKRSFRVLHVSKRCQQTTCNYLKVIFSKSLAGVCLEVKEGRGFCRWWKKCCDLRSISEV